MHADPLVQLSGWLDEAVAAGLPNAEAMALATASASGRPSVRFVLCKEIDARGVVFYTNTGSRKGRELAGNGHAAVAFHWTSLGRQVRVTGSAAAVSRVEAEAYYRTRPLGSRIGAWASPQSRPIGSREELEALWARAAHRLGDDPPLPPHWGGYRIVAETIEFWEHRDSRLHDRLLYTRTGDAWERTRLAP